MTKKPEPDDPEQYRRFIDTAQKVEAEEAPEAFDRAFKKVAPAKPKASPIRTS